MDLLWTSPLCLVTSFWMVLSTGVTGGTAGGLVGVTGLGMTCGLRVDTGGFRVGITVFLVGTAGLPGGGVALFGGRGALVVVVVVVVVVEGVDLGMNGKILFDVTGGRTVVVVLLWSKSGMWLW